METCYCSFCNGIEAFIQTPSQDYLTSLQSLRRTATTLLHEAGVPSTVAQALIGHDSEEVHSDYITVGREALRNAAHKFPAL